MSGAEGGGLGMACIRRERRLVVGGWLVLGGWRLNDRGRAGRRGWRGVGWWGMESKRWAPGFADMRLLVRRVMVRGGWELVGKAWVHECGGKQVMERRRRTWSFARIPIGFLFR